MKLEDFKTPTISRGRKLLASVPYIIIAGLLINTWNKFYSDEYDASLLHYIT